MATLLNDQPHIFKNDSIIMGQTARTNPVVAGLTVYGDIWASGTIYNAANRLNAEIINGTGSSSYVLSKYVDDRPDSYMVVVAGLFKVPGIDYTITGSTKRIQFTSAPTVGQTIVIYTTIGLYTTPQTPIIATPTSIKTGYSVINSVINICSFQSIGDIISKNLIFENGLYQNSQGSDIMYSVTQSSLIKKENFSLNSKVNVITLPLNITYQEISFSVTESIQNQGFLLGTNINETGKYLVFFDGILQESAAYAVINNNRFILTGSTPLNTTVSILVFSDSRVLSLTRLVNANLGVPLPTTTREVNIPAGNYDPLNLLVFVDGIKYDLYVDYFIVDRDLRFIDSSGIPAGSVISAFYFNIS